MSSQNTSNKPSLFILESPNKVKKIQGFLGDDYMVTASKGHIRNLGKEKEMGIDINNNFTPVYYISPGKGTVVTMLKGKSRRCQTIILATDYDREGEAIAWHVAQVLGVKVEDCERVIFTEITKKAILNSLKNPTKLDMEMVHSQQARMILDKLIGYHLSPTLWKQFKNYKLSAGRVQSVVVKLIIEREREIEKFQSSNYFKVIANFNIDQDAKALEKGNNYDIETEADFRLTEEGEVANILHNTQYGNAKFVIDSVKKSKGKRNPAPPFITSSLQQEASCKLGMSPDVCMSSAQRLYEAGLITYMRTDSLILSEEALGNLEKYIKDKFGDNYHKKTQYNKKKAKGAQEAHEACRPTDIKKVSVHGVDKITGRDNKLYQLIWKRTVACQMTPADIETKTIKVKCDDTECKPKLNTKKYNENKPYLFTGKYEKVVFDGFLKLYNTDDFKASDEEEDGEEEEEEVTDKKKSRAEILKEKKQEKKDKQEKMDKLFKSLKSGLPVYCGMMEALEKQTKCPVARFTEASLIKKLEELGIGRPSTYASMVTKVQEKAYVEKKTIDAKEKDFTQLVFQFPKEVNKTTKKMKVDGVKNKLMPTGLGSMTNEFLLSHFDKMMDYGFTAAIETQLDEIANGKINWVNVVRGVFNYMNPIIEKIGLVISEGGSMSRLELGTHPTTNLPLVIILTKYGWSICEENPVKKQSRWASIGSTNPKSITVNDAVKLLVYPKDLGEYKGEKLQVLKAKSVYIKWGKANYSIDQYKQQVDAEGDLDTSTLDKKKVVEIITYLDKANKELKEKQKEEIKVEGLKNCIIKNGPYGYYMKYKGKYNVPLPKKIKDNISSLTSEEGEKILMKFKKKKNIED